ncbi:porin [Janthinobacterium agaricidamnosum]|uniref:Gram-negative porin family protein n=1 Tax=Janthinobacterium agaricidamnosum NBRC 102515 = DSM 9628 TaxID=1349767 RepID=W0V0N1_9BURK|nr:porin [Janthinobacterium agaricidamnosum]CDG80893.1 gram-negative porin family protein [Janthinobacterium agaricidamnosum NBRC 102515 = DSM 9628]
MKKVMTLLAWTAGAMGAAHAQSNVTVYGYLDAAVASERGGAAGAVSKLASSVAAPSRLGFHGEEKLDGNLTALFNIETGIALDTGGFTGANVFARSDYVGLRGDFGTLRLGNIQTALYETVVTVADPMGNGLAGQAGNLMTAGVVGGPTSPGGRGNFRGNTVAYTSPLWNGAGAELDYSAGEAPGDSSKQRSIGGALAYKTQRLSTRLAWLSSVSASGTDSATSTLWGANYNFGRFTGYLSYGRNKGYTTLDSRELLTGAAIPLGQGKVLLSYIRKDDRSAVDNDGHQVAVGYSYPLSKRSSLFASYARIGQHAAPNSSAFYSINIGAPGIAGGGDRAFAAGMSHFF